VSSVRVEARPRDTPFADLGWNAGPLSFELVSSNPAVLDRARVVFGPWLNGSTGGGSRRVRFRVEADGGSGRQLWRVERNGNGEATVAESMDFALAAVEYAAIAELVAPDTGVVSLHAALLSRAGRGILLVGPKESGKSTLACALLGAGWRIHSDDTAQIEDGPRARGIPRRVALRATSRELLGAGTWDRIRDLPGTTSTRNGVLFHPSEFWLGKAPASVEPVAVFFLARRASTVAPARLHRLDPGRALLALAPYSNRCLAGIASALEALQPLADRVPVFDLGRGDIATMIERVEEAAAK
jgi:hypothetical protein